MHLQPWLPWEQPLGSFSPSGTVAGYEWQGSHSLHLGWVEGTERRGWCLFCKAIMQFMICQPPTTSSDICSALCLGHPCELWNWRWGGGLRAVLACHTLVSRSVEGFSIDAGFRQLGLKVHLLPTTETCTSPLGSTFTTRPNWPSDYDTERMGINLQWAVVLQPFSLRITEHCTL